MDPGSDTGHLEKADSMPKFAVWIKKIIFGKFEGADFKYDNNILKISAQKYSKKEILTSSLGNFIFARNFHVGQIRGGSFQVWQYYFQVHKKGNFGPKFKDFHFCIKLYNEASSKVLTSNMTDLFQNCFPNHPGHFLFQIFIFARNVAIRQIARH